jgi:hypothetical protein
MQLAELLARLPPAPEALVRAAQELPAARAGLDDLVARATADAAYRRAVLEDLERALRGAGVAPKPSLVRMLRRRLER